MTPSKEPNGAPPKDAAAETPGDDAKLLSLVAEWRVADDEHKRVVHEHSVEEEAGHDDPDGYRRTEDAVDIVCALERRIIRDVPAETLAGLVAKLEVATAESGALSDHRKIWDAQEWSLWSCWQDAKRLVARDAVKGGAS